MSEAGQPAAGSTTRRRPRPAHLSAGALVIPAFLVVLGVFLVVGTSTMDVVGDAGLFGPTVMPWAVAVICFVIAALLAVDILRPRPEYEPVFGARTPAATGSPDAADAAEPDAVNATAVAVAVGGVIVFIAVLPWLGWILSATLLFTAIAMALGNRSYVTILLAGLGLASVIQIVFSGLLGISLPAGFVGGF
ncbi:tripartite tricarboxylate transporter TctB family protein [Modestobacter sp. VKM Ac-2985]|uniref:tripartite tricarboxylate transporter TctB family protein n=1 Tax=Modestobacter sp. VKM Ac-2985 TaxID=3004139 RepID=UPI0022ABB12D|nr:tripartite tricarboxylate transporter TctB family protein [Modestobacter sp. VKM Ac-2985]MCZ2839186.1 tripartite tricarboxylate transporter TctB family protein [Modestobacter sp. VKM Ac-2985]